MTMTARVRMGMIVDCHAHLDASEFSRDLDEVIARALEAGVSYIITAGSDLESSRASVALAERYPSVYAAVGFHPHEAARMIEGDIEALEELCSHPKVVAIG